ncbi:unnamed protein product [Urochloa humidicola]
MARIAAGHAFLRDLCSPGSFVVLAKQLLFPLALLDIAVTWCTVGFSKRIYGLTGVRAAVAGGSHLLLCVVSFSVLLQATLAAGTLFVIRNKRSIGELPAATRRWCRRAIFVAYILHTIAILCFVVFATALVGGSKFMFVAMEVIAWPVILAFCFIGSYMAMYAH